MSPDGRIHFNPATIIRCGDHRYLQIGTRTWACTVCLEVHDTSGVYVPCAGPPVIEEEDP